MRYAQQHGQDGYTPVASVRSHVPTESDVSVGYTQQGTPLEQKSANIPQESDVRPPRYSRIQVCQRALLALTRPEKVYVPRPHATDAESDVRKTVQISFFLIVV